MLSPSSPHWNQLRESETPLKSAVEKFQFEKKLPIIAESQPSNANSLDQSRTTPRQLDTLRRSALRKTQKGKSQKDQKTVSDKHSGYIQPTTYAKPTSFIH